MTFVRRAFLAGFALIWLLGSMDVPAATVTLESPEDGAIVNRPQVDFHAVVEGAAGSTATLVLGALGPDRTLNFSGSDAQIDAGLPDDNFGASAGLNVDGLDPHAHAVLKFSSLIGDSPTQIPPGAIVRSATLVLNCIDPGSVMSAYRLLEDWDEGAVTWNRRTSGVPWTDPGADGPGSRDTEGYPADCTATGPRSIDLTGMVQAWAAGEPNCGLVLVDGGDDGVDFDSREGGTPPVLIVTFASVVLDGGQVFSFTGPEEVQDAQIQEGSDQNLGAAPSVNVDGLSPHAHAVLKVSSLIGDAQSQIPPGATIRSATLNLSCSNPGDLMTAYRLMEDWDETAVTWNERSAGIFWMNPGADGAGSRDTVGYPADCTATGMRSIDLTEMVQSWADGASNYGLVLVNGGDDGVDFDSSEGGTPPVLTVVIEPATQGEQTEPISVPVVGSPADVYFPAVPVVDGTQYLWNCRVVDGSQQESWAEMDATFSVDVNLPDVPVLVSPADGSLGLLLDPTLSVQVGDPNTDDTLDVAFYGRTPSTAESFTLVVLPDTQKYTLNDGLEVIFEAQTTWIVEQKDASNIVFVSHEGDLVDTPTSHSEYLEAQAAMRTLDGVVPYGVLPGNHDTPTDLFNQYFPVGHYSGNAWYGGNYPADKNDNNYQLFSAGGIDFIILHLGWWPSTDAIAWADGVLKTHSERMAIITTHGFLDATGARTVHIMGSTEYIWEGLVVPNDNVYFVLCGHVHAEVARTDVVNGRQVHQLLADYQTLSNGGEGYLRIMRFVPAENTVYVETYSPWLDAYQTDANSEFALQVPLNRFELLGSVADAPIGSVVEMPWPDRPLGTTHEWMVEVTDSTDRTRTSPVWSFHTTDNDATPPVISETEALDVTDRSARIVWTTDEPATSEVEYWVDEVPVTSVSDPELTTNHEVRLDGLNPATTYSYQVLSKDGSGNGAMDGTYSFITPAENLPPVVADLVVIAYEDESVEVVLSGTDPNGDTLTYSVANPPTHGALSGSGATLTYTPDTDYSGLDSFTYVADDGQLTSGLGTVSITVNAVNDPPAIPQGLTASASAGRVDLDWADNVEPEDDLAGYKVYRDTGDGYSWQADTALSAYADETVIDGETYWYYVTSVDEAGLESAPSAEVSATPSDTLFDAYAGSNPAVTHGSVVGDFTATWESDGLVQSITEGPNGQAGMASLDIQYLLYTTADPTAVTSLSLVLAGSWTAAESNDDLHAFIWDGSGWLEIPELLSSGEWMASSFPGTYIGADQAVAIRFTDSAPIRKETKDMLSVELLYARIRAGAGSEPPPIENQPPVAVDDSASTPVDVAVDIDVLANDSDQDGDSLAIESWTAPSNGSVSHAGAGVLTYTPASGFTGDDSFSYVVSDGQGHTASASVSITVQAAGSASEMIVSGIEMSLTSAGKNWKASATITVTAADQPVPNATVTCNWYFNGDLVSSGAMGITDGAGTVVLESSPQKASSGEEFRIEVVDVTADGYEYNPVASVTEKIISP